MSPRRAKKLVLALSTSKLAFTTAREFGQHGNQVLVRVRVETHPPLPFTVEWRVYAVTPKGETIRWDARKLKTWQAAQRRSNAAANKRRVVSDEVVIPRGVPRKRKAALKPVEVAATKTTPKKRKSLTPTKKESEAMTSQKFHKSVESVEAPVRPVSVAKFVAITYKDSAPGQTLLAEKLRRAAQEQLAKEAR